MNLVPEPQRPPAHLSPYGARRGAEYAMLCVRLAFLPGTVGQRHASVHVGIQVGAAGQQPLCQFLEELGVFVSLYEDGGYPEANFPHVLRERPRSDSPSGWRICRG